MTSGNYDPSSLYMAKENLEKQFNNSRFKIQTVPLRIRESGNYEKYYKPELISIGPIHHNDPRLQQGEEYKRMWTAMFAERHRKDLKHLYKRVLDQIDCLRELFLWNDIKLEIPYNDKDLAEMLLVDGCAVLLILENARPEELKLKVDQLALARRDLLLLENQIPHKVLKLLADDEKTLKKSMHNFCTMQNMFSTIDYRIDKIFPTQSTEIDMSSLNHLLDCLRIIILCNDKHTENQVCQQTQDRESQVYQVTQDKESQSHPVARDGESQVYQVTQHQERQGRVAQDGESQVYQLTPDEEESQGPVAQDAESEGYQVTQDEESQGHLVAQDGESPGQPSAQDRKSIFQVFWQDILGVPNRYISYLSDLANEEQFTYRTIRELKAAAIRMKRQDKVNLREINFSPSFFGGKLYLPPLILNDSTVPTLLNLIAYEMCPHFINSLEICSYIRLLDLLIDDPEDVKQLRRVGILQNSLGSDKEVSELFNNIGSQLAHNQELYSIIKDELEQHYKKRISIWLAEAYYTHCRSPWTIIALLAASAFLIMTFLQTLKAFKSK